MVKLLLDSKADLNAKTLKGEGVLHVAAAYSTAEVCQALVLVRCNMELKDKRGAVPLLAAIRTGNEGTVHFLLAAGANVEACDADKAAGLHWAAEPEVYTPGVDQVQRTVQETYVRIVGQLLQHRANIDAKDKFGHTPLILAARAGRDQVARTLIDAKAMVTVACLFSMRK